jgi:hypothetical protein
MSALNSIVGRFANQQVTLERLDSQDPWGTPTYEAAETISARYEPNTGLVTTFAGESAQVESFVLTETEVGLGDLIEGSEVRRVEPIINKKGVTLGYKVYL